MTDTLHTFDDWIQDDSPIGAVVMRQHLEPIEGSDAVIFPPTYPIDRNGAGYNIDRFEDGTSVCQIDSVGSQANRMEPIFKRAKYRTLIPQVVIEAEGRELHILDAGHRAADAIVRFSIPINSQLYQAFAALRDQGEAESLARIAPTSIVFGAWDSRGTQVKLPRIVRSVIRAFNIKEIHRSAQYATIAGEILEDGEAETGESGAKAELGLTHVPSVETHGGVRAEGGIRRDAVLNLSPLRSLGSASVEPEDEARLRRYILGLCLIAFTAPAEIALREGCELVPSVDKSAEWKVVRHDGKRDSFNLSHDAALEFAVAAADDFGVEQEEIRAKFDSALARRLLSANANSRKNRLRQDPATW